jgi:hypothetical protein
MGVGEEGGEGEKSREEGRKAGGRGGAEGSRSVKISGSGLSEVSLILICTLEKVFSLPANFLFVPNCCRAELGS